MKNKGFTLVEILAVVCVLAALIVIIVPKVTDSIDQAEDKAYDDQLNVLISAAKRWGASNTNKLLGEDSDVLCTAKTSVTNGNLAEGNYNYGDEYSCDVGDGETKTFYVLEDGDTTTLTTGKVAQSGEVSLIMNMNIDSEGKGTTSGNTVSWCKSGSDYSCAADGAFEYLQTSTTSWTKLNSDQIGLPNSHQLAQASGKTFNNTYFSGLSTWLYGNLNSSSSPNAYWTSTPYVSNSSYACNVYYDGSVRGGSVANDDIRGIRPVITINKSQIKTGMNEAISLSFDTLIDEGYIKQKKIINPKTDEELEGCIKISYVQEYSQYKYEYTDDNTFCGR